jgi:hypothetical protein
MNGENKIFNQEDFKKIDELMKNLLGEDLFNQFSLENWDVEKIKKILRTPAQVKQWSESLTYSVKEIWKLLPNISALSAMLLIIATFNKELVPLNFSVKILLSILLILIPLGLWSTYIDLTKTVEKSLKQLEKIIKENLGKDISEEIKKIRRQTVLGFMPFCIVTIFSFVVLLIICLIWKIDLIKFLMDIF